VLEGIDQALTHVAIAMMRTFGVVISSVFPLVSSFHTLSRDTRKCALGQVVVYSLLCRTYDPRVVGPNPNTADF
jgi:hypothetical protein